MQKEERERIDSIYDFVSLDDGDSEKLSADMWGHLNRLESIRHLGMIPFVFTLARHDKLEHAFGTYWLCRSAGEWNHRLNVDYEALRLAGLLHGVGHAPWTYTTEQALLQLYQLHDGTHNWLLDVFKGCEEFMGPERGSIGAKAQKLIDTSDYFQIYKWLTVSKIAKDPKLNNQLGRRIARHLLDSDYSGAGLLAILDRVDYSLRDLHYLGTARLHLNLPPFLREFRTETKQITPPPFNWVLREANYFLTDEVYESHDVRVLSSLARKAIICAVTSGAVSPQELVGITDDEIELLLKEEVVPRFDIREWADRLQRGEVIKVLLADCVLDGPEVRREANLAGVRAERIHQYPSALGVVLDCTVVPLEDPNEKEAKATVSFDMLHGKIPRALGAVARCELSIPNVHDNSEISYAEEVFGFLLGWQVYADWAPHQREMETTVRKHLVEEFNVVDEDLAWDKNWRLWDSARLLCDIESDDDRQMASRVAQHFVKFPHHFTVECCERILTSLSGSRIKRRRRESAIASQQRRQRRKEYVRYLELVIAHKRSGVHFWALPSAKAEDETGISKAEFDVISVSIPKPHQGPAHMILHEVSETLNSTKRRETEEKFDRVANRLRERFGRRSGIKLSGFLNDQRLHG